MGPAHSHTPCYNTWLGRVLVASSGLGDLRGPPDCKQLIRWRCGAGGPLQLRGGGPFEAVRIRGGGGGGWKTGSKGQAFLFLVGVGPEQRLWGGGGMGVNQICLNFASYDFFELSQTSCDAFGMTRLWSLIRVRISLNGPPSLELLWLLLWLALWVWGEEGKGGD